MLMLNRQYSPAVTAAGGGAACYADRCNVMLSDAGTKPA